MAQLFASLVFTVLQNFPLAKTGVPQTVLTQVAFETLLAALSLSGAFLLTKLAFLPLH